MISVNIISGDINFLIFYLNIIIVDCPIKMKVIVS